MLMTKRPGVAEGPEFGKETFSRMESASPSVNRGVLARSLSKSSAWAWAAAMSALPGLFAVGLEVGQHGVEGLEGAAECDAVDDQLGGEGLHLVGRGEAEGVIDETHAARVGLEDGHLVIEAEQVGEERTHPTRTEDKDLHDSVAFSPWFITIICWRTDSSWMFLRMACTKSGFSSIAAPALARFSRISP